MSSCIPSGVCAGIGTRQFFSGFLSKSVVSCPRGERHDIQGIRITGRLGITDGSKDPLQVERQLRERIPPKESNNFCHRMVLFGRDTCTARSPKCEGCPLAKDCDTAKAARRG